MRKLKNFIYGLFFCTWHSERPTLFLWLKFCRETDVTLTSESQLIWANCEIIKEIQEEKFFGHQEISAVERQDRELSKRSFFREVAQARLHTKEGIVLNGPYLMGGMKKVTDVRELQKIVHSLSFQARKIGLKITEIEIAHSHKGLEIMIVDGQRSQLVMNGLSLGDKKTGAFLGERLHFPLRIKAVTDRLAYSMIF